MRSAADNQWFDTQRDFVRPHKYGVAHTGLLFVEYIYAGYSPVPVNYFLGSSLVPMSAEHMWRN
ncbi:hypothetical protein LJ754_16330 [Arthrobacter sp. zg-Y40]|uniref:hypothetical protein n=1 Tax=Arthrobacter sp. zg-Y40 TaxID=2886939 RepID=UPI001D159B76|nr:hypothetical protein [Arthrobacter sp. zg-Y40]MCC3280715.1 hypothetical protein [Arthrobacter sp. zg-Y40]